MIMEYTWKNSLHRFRVLKRGVRALGVNRGEKSAEFTCRNRNW